MHRIARFSKSAKWRKLLRVAQILAAVYLAACAGCAGFQRRLIYFPPKFDSSTAEKIGAAEHLERWKSADGRATGWKRLAAAQPAAGRVLIVHGNAGCAAYCGIYADVIQHAAPLDVFAVEYPGYADCPGKPTERTLDCAAEEALRILAAEGPVYLVGESLGTGVATYLAGKYPDKVAGVVLLAPYNSLTDVAQAHAPVLPVHLILRDRFPSEKYLRTYQGPVAMLVCGHDQVVPAKFGRRLYDTYSGPKRLWEFPEGNHGTVMQLPVEVWRQIFQFLNSERRIGT